MLEILILVNHDHVEYGGEARPALDVEDVIHTASAIEGALGRTGLARPVVATVSSIAEARRVLAACRPDLVVNLIESLHRNEGFESASAFLLERSGVRFTGSGAAALRACLDKGWTARVLAAAGLPIPGTRVVSDAAGSRGFPLPAIVKPLRTDASIGITTGSVVRSTEALEAAVERVSSGFGGRALVQEFVEGREVNAALIGNSPPVMLPPSEIDFTGFPPDRPRIMSYESKWVEDSPEFTGTHGMRARLSGTETRTLEIVARRVFEAMGLRDYGRVDFRLDSHGGWHVIEVNPNCSLSPDGGFARSCRFGGLDYDAMVWRIVTLALGRS